MSSLIIRNGRVIDPANNKDEICDVYVVDGIITDREPANPDEIIDAKGMIVMPGLIDMHVHFRDPGFTYKEDIMTGSKSAAKGGFTTVCCMPNTKPVIDSPEVVEYIIDKAKEAGLTNVLPVGAVTKGMEGIEVTDVEALKEAGICAISEDGKSVMNSGVYRKAMINAKNAGIPVLAHCEDINLVGGGSLNRGKASEKYDDPGITNAVEDIIAYRDILLAEETGATLHLCHCSTKDSVKYLEEARSKGVKVTAEACPHHFTLCDEDIDSNDANYKMNPPLRSREDMEAIIEGLKKDIITVISTDHAPHSEEEKSRPIKNSPFGIVGLETSVALTITELVKKGHITYKQMAEKMSLNPAKILGIDKGTLTPGKVADITVIDPDIKYTIDKNSFVSKGKNTPFDKKEVFGKTMYTILGGKVVYKE